jgi:hypothetical protein
MPPDSRDLPHIFLDGGGVPEPYTSPRTVRSPKPPERDRGEHGERIAQSLGGAVEQARQALSEEPPDVAPAERGAYLEFQVPSGQEEVYSKLENRPKRIELVSVQQHEDGSSSATVFVPEAQLAFFQERVRAYREEETKSGRPKNEGLVARVDLVRLATIRSLYTDSPSDFPSANNAIWWEVWLRPEMRGAFARAAAALGLRTNDHVVVFPEREVRLVLATPLQLDQALRRSEAIAELRIARDTPAFFLAMPSVEQALWISDLASRTDPPPNASVAVCLLDAGITRSHPLLEALVDVDDVHTCNPAWGSSDNPGTHGHGTAMAGLCLYGDLTDVLNSSAWLSATHRLESVKLLPPSGVNEPDVYGQITIEAIARAEVQAPTRSRAICMAVTSNHQTDKGKPSAWSAAIDQACYNSGDAQRLIFISGGNIREDLLASQFPDANDLAQIESPAQAWNAVTVGACTDKIHISSGAYDGWHAVAPAGALSPRSRTSTTWGSQWPIKPDIVLEGGNLAHNGASNPAELIPDLCVLSLHHQPQVSLLREFGDTSAATALAARMGARLLADRPDLWPETIRALLVHSAEWTPAMREGLTSSPNGQAKRIMLRRYGYGLPSVSRALASARNDLTLVIQDQLTPFRRDGSRLRTREMHIHRLPWPREQLEAIGHTNVELRVTLSYYVEPNPGERGWSKRHSYASHGLRFEVKGAVETDDQFRARINRAARDDEAGTATVSLPSDRWFLGSRLRNAGSIHSDIWTGTAAELAQRGAVGVYPVTGWWKEKPGQARWENVARYALLITLRVPEIDVDIYTPVVNAISPIVEITT